MKGISFSQWSILQEIDLRGKVMTTSADLEFILLKIIVACLADEPTATARKFKTLPLEAKIGMLKHDIKKYQKTKYDKYRQIINQLDKVKNFRNWFAHCKMEWDRNEKDGSFFYILIISEVKEKEKPQLIKVTFNQFNTKMNQMRGVILALTALCHEIETEFYNKYPDFFKASQP